MTLAQWMTYLPAAIYLVVLTVPLVAGEKVPPAGHVLLVVTAAVARVILVGPKDALVPLLVVAVAFIPAVLIGRRMLSVQGVLALLGTMALLWFPQWLAVVAGLGLAAAIAAVQTVAGNGMSRLSLIVVETLSGMGINLNGSFSRPDPSRIQTRDDDMSAHADHRQYRLYLPPCLLGGIVALATWQALNHGAIFG